MTKRRGLHLLAVGVLAIMSLQAQPAAARDCFWDGSGPICRGHCTGGYKTIKVKIAGCLNGFKVLCCEPLGSISQAQTRRR
jgi:hypothetical protein